MVVGRHAGLAGLALAALLAPPALSQAAREAALRQGPRLQVQTPGGQALEVQRMKGKVVVLDFMTTVCPACREASAGLEKLYREFGARGFQPIAVALNVDSPAALREYCQQHGLTFLCGTASRADVGSYLQHPADKPFLVPTLVLLDRQGRIRSIDTGWRGEEQLRTEIMKLLPKR